MIRSRIVSFLSALLIACSAVAGPGGIFIQPRRSSVSGGGGGGGVPATGQTLFFDNFNDSAVSTSINGQSLTSGGGTWSESSNTLKEGATAGKLTTPSGTEAYAQLNTGTTTITSGNYGVFAKYFPNGITSTKRFTLVGRNDGTDARYYRFQISDGSGHWTLDVGPDDYTFCSGTLSDWSSGTTTHSLELRMVGSTITAWDEGVQISTNCVDTHWPGASGDTVQVGIRQSGVQADDFGVIGR